VTSFWNTAFAVAAKDLRLEGRSREALVPTGFFALLLTVLFGFAFQSEPVDPRTQAPGLLWAAFSFAGVIALQRSFALERDGNCLRALLLAPVDRGALFVGKALANFLLIGLVEAVVLPIFSVLLRVPVAPCLGPLALIICLATLGFVEVGTLFSGMASGTRLRDVLLPLVLYPVWVPILVAAVESTGLVLSGRPLSEAREGLILLAVFDAIFLGLGLLFFEHVVEE